MSNSIDANTLPALPLPDSVILPGMVVTIAADSDEARPRPGPRLTPAVSSS